MTEGEIKNQTDGIGETLADVSTLTCTPCLSEIIEVKAKCYCVQCKEYLCEECVRFHQKVTVTKLHTLRDAEHAVPADVCDAIEEGLSVKIGSRGCQIHPGQVVERFCTAHMVLCCSMCLEDKHSSCKTESISTVSEGYAQSEKLRALTGKLIELKTSIHDIIQRKHKQTKSNLETFLNGSKTRLKTVAENILSLHIDTTASAVKKGIIEGINSSEEELQNILKDIHQIQVSLDSKTDDEEELFVRATRESSKLRMFEDVIRPCRENSHSPWILFINPNCQTILSKYVSLKPTTTTALRVKQPLESKCSITDIECLSDGRFVLVDSSNKALKLFKCNNEFQSTHCLQKRPSNVVEVEPGRLVVTIPEENSIRFVSVTDIFKEDGNVQVDDTPTGLATFGGKNFVSFITHLRIIDRDGNTIERISKGRSGEDLFVNLTCILINDKTGRFYAVDEGRLAFVHVESIRQMDTRNSSVVLLYQDGRFKPSMTFDEDNSLYLCIPEGIRHLNPDLVELQIFQYTEFYTPIRLNGSPSTKDSETTAVTTASVGAGNRTGFSFQPTFGFSTTTGSAFGTTSVFGSSSNSSRDKQATTPNQHVVTFPKYAMCCRKSVGQLLIGGESDKLSIVHIG